MGVHIWAGELVLQMKEQPGYEDIGLVVVLPAPGHDAKWDVRSRKRLEQLLRNCTEQLTIGTQPSPENYARQNRCLVDHADFLIAVSDGEGEIVGYARKKKMEILRIHPDTAVVDGDVWVGEA